VVTTSPPDAGGAWDVLVLGIGNLLWADEGFGVRCVESLNARYRFPERVEVMDGGTQGIFLLPWVRAATRLLILDAIDFGLPPATLRVIRGDDVPRFMGAKKVSMHQAGFQEVLASAELCGELPRELVLIGVQPKVLNDYGASLTADVKAQIAPAVALACRVLRDWGIEPRVRAASLTSDELIGPGALAISDYEGGRPGRRGEAP
jgi:hydrogenase maturation protease